MLLQAEMLLAAPATGACGEPLPPERASQPSSGREKTVRQQVFVHVRGGCLANLAGTGLPVFQESPPDPVLSPPPDLGLLPIGGSGHGLPFFLLSSARNSLTALDQGLLSLWASLCSSVSGACGAQEVWALRATPLGPESGLTHMLVSILCLG